MTASAFFPQVMSSVNGGLKTMLLPKLKMAVATAAILAVGESGTVVVAHHALQGQANIVVEEGKGVLKPEDMEKLRKFVKPGEGECHWAKIPWMSDVGEARKRAAAEGKPILLWVAQGEPLGLA